MCGVSHRGSQPNKAIMPSRCLQIAQPISSIGSEPASGQSAFLGVRKSSALLNNVFVEAGFAVEKAVGSARHGHASAVVLAFALARLVRPSTARSHDRSGQSVNWPQIAELLHPSCSQSSGFVGWLR